MKTNKLLSHFCLFTFAFLLSNVLSVNAQNLTVKEIMREPSIAGMRVEGERLSPDGKFVIYLWNAEGKEPRDLYLVSTSGGEAKKILSPQDLVKNKETEKEDKLNYGVVINDDFAKSQKNGLGNLAWSPDSTKILFAQNGDLYVLSLNSKNPNKFQQESIDLRWQRYKTAMERQAGLVPNLINYLKQNRIQEKSFFDELSIAHSQLVNALKQNSQISESEFVISKYNTFRTELERFLKFPENYSDLRSKEDFSNLADEVVGNDNRINVARTDYKDAVSEIAFQPKRITKTESFEFSARFLDNDRILFQQSGNIFSIDTKDGTLVQISKEANSSKNINVSNATPSKDGAMLAYVAGEGVKQKPIFVPNYLGELTTVPSYQRGWTNQTIYAAMTDGSFEKSIAAELPKAEGESYFQGLEWLADGKTLLVDRVDKTHKRRQIFVVQFADDKSKAFLVHEETDDKWIGSPARILEANPKNANQFFFGSEKDGFYHLYLVNLDESKFKDGKANAEIKQLTEGNWEVDWAKWEFKGENIIYTSTQFSPTERRFGFVKTKPSAKYTVWLPSPTMNIGMQTNPQLENSVLMYSHSEWNKPDEIYAYGVINTGVSKAENSALDGKLTNTTPESFLKRKFNEPKFIEIKSRDNKKIPAKIYLPENFDKTKKYPMVIFVHGAGYLQNVINGWNNYYREFMFNELLTQKGYVVLDIDYRGSAGYGRDWRTDVYDFLGGKDYEDHLDAIDFMTANYAVDVKRIGVYGGSYGGFMAAMLVMRAPDKIAAAAALRPVMDWKNYYAANPFYTSQRLRSPQENPEGYKRSSPITYAGNLQKRLLILHGLVDNNVQIQDSIQLVEQLIRLDKTEYFDLMIYPAENHAFQRPSSWEDEYERILELFEKNLK